MSWTEFGNDRCVLTVEVLRSATQTMLEFSRPVAVNQYSVNGMVLKLMSDGQWWTPYELARKIAGIRGKWISDSGVTARIRDLRKVRWGSHVVEVRKRANSDSWEYRLL